MSAAVMKLLVASLTAVLLVTSQGSFAAAQGATTSLEAMRSNASAAAAEADRFLDLIGFAMRPASNSSAGLQSKGKYLGNFSSISELQSLQTALYQIASSYQYYGAWDPTQNLQGISLLPSVRDQGQCYTTVAHAVASAVEAAIAAATGTNASQWDVSPQSLHYCSGQNRTCNTAWTLQEALEVMAHQAPQLVRPTKCSKVNGVRNLLNDSYAAETTAETWRDVCSAVQKRCSGITRDTPWLQCSYKPLRSFWEIQRHVRNYGAALSIMNVHEDLDSHFQAASKGRHAKPYRPSPSASILYAQAVLIVGYSNVASTDYEPSFTVLTSWGTKRTHAGARSAAITNDGLYRIAMGAAGVGSPDNTWGVQCQPAPGSELDPHSLKSWSAGAGKHAESHQAQNRNNLSLTQETPCYNYTVQRDDTPAAIADAFNMSIVKLVTDNMQLFKITNRSYHFPFPLTGQQLKQVLTAVTNTTAAYAALQNIRFFEPYVECWMMTDQNATTCYLDDLTPCFASKAARSLVRRVNTACTLHYPDLAVTRNSVSPGQALQVCSGDNPPSTPRLHSSSSAPPVSPRLSQPQALAALLAAVIDTAAAANYTIPSGAGYCNPGNYSQAWHAADAPVKVWSSTGGSRYACSPEGYITYLSLVLERQPGRRFLLNDSGLVSAILQFPKLKALDIVGGTGALPPQFGALENLERLTIRQHCLTGTIPNNYGLNWPNMTSLTIVPKADSSVSSPASSLAACGLTGSIPESMLAHVAPSLRQLQLQGNKLTGSLPASIASLSQLCLLNLRSNQLTSSIPEGMLSLFGACYGDAMLDLSHNNFSGAVPSGLSRLPVQKVVLSHNKLLTSCLLRPNDSSVAVEFSATSITDFCEVLQTRQQLEQSQYDALTKYLPRLVAGHSAFVEEYLNHAPANLSAWIQPNKSVGSSDTVTLTDPSGQSHVTIVLARIDRVTYITQITGSHVGLDTSVLAKLASQLPQLQTYNFRFCDKPTAGNPNATVLPADLAQAAPASFTSLSLANCNIQGSLPPEWANWDTLEELWIQGNAITGVLPGSWAEGMKSLRILYAERNQIGGLLPASWGQGVMPSNMFINLNTNPALFGPIPATWSRFEGLVWIERTAVKSCVPAPMMDNIITDDTYRVGDIACPLETVAPSIPQSPVPANPTKPAVPVQPSPDPVNATGPGAPEIPVDHQLIALTGVKDVLGGTAALPSWTDRAEANGTAGYCTWPGVLCNSTQHVIALNISKATGSAGTAAAAPDLLQLMQHVKRLSSIHTLHLASLRLHGTLPADMATQLKSLRYFNISGNPGVAGMLPKTWVALTNLQYLDVSDCSVSGPLPEGYATLQMLRVFRASRTLLSGSLPNSWGLLGNLLELEISHSNLTGVFPDWGNATVLQAMGAAKAAAATKAAAVQAVTTATAAAAREVPAAAGKQARVMVLQAALASLQTSKGSADLLLTAAAMDDADPLQAVNANVLQYRQAQGAAHAVSVIAEALQAALDAATAAEAAETAAQAADTVETSGGTVAGAVETVSTAAMDMHGVVLSGTSLHTLSSKNGVSDASRQLSVSSKNITAPSFSKQHTVAVNGTSRTSTTTAMSSNHTSFNKSASPSREQVAAHANTTTSSINSDAASTKGNGAVSSIHHSTSMVSNSSMQHAVDAHSAGHLGKADGSKTMEINTTSSKLDIGRHNNTAIADGGGASLTAVLTIGSPTTGKPSTAANPSRNGRPKCAHGTCSNNTALFASSSVVLGYMPLKVLRLKGNRLTGQLPDNLYNLKGLRTLDLSENDLSGTLPETLAEMVGLQELLLSSNRLDGLLPHYYARLSNLVRLDLSNNTFRGMLPPTWVGMKAAVTINVANNQLIGPIPKDLALMAGAMHNLCCLAVYGNQFEQQSVQDLQTMLQSRPHSRMKLITNPDEQYLCNRLKTAVAIRQGDVRT